MNIEYDSIKKLQEVNNLLNMISVNGLANLHYLYTSILNVQKILQEIERDNQVARDDEGIVIDNTKEVKV